MGVTQFSCPHCSGLFQVDGSLGGQQVACPHCRGVVALPTMADSPRPTAPDPDPASAMRSGASSPEVPLRPLAAAPGPGTQAPRSVVHEQSVASVPGFPPQTRGAAFDERPLSAPQPARPQPTAAGGSLPAAAAGGEPLTARIGPAPAPPGPARPVPVNPVPVNPVPVSPEQPLGPSRPPAATGSGPTSRAALPGTTASPVVGHVPRPGAPSSTTPMGATSSTAPMAAATSQVPGPAGQTVPTVPPSGTQPVPTVPQPLGPATAPGARPMPSTGPRLPMTGPPTGGPLATAPGVAMGGPIDPQALLPPGAASSQPRPLGSEPQASFSPLGAASAHAQPPGGFPRPIVVPAHGLASQRDPSPLIRTGGDDLETQKRMAAEKEQRKFKRNLILWTFGLLILGLTIVILQLLGPL